MNKISFLLTALLALLVFQGCKKDSAPTAPQQKSYLVKTVTTNGSVTETFTYDDKNRMKTWTLPLVFEYRFTYDNQDRLTETQIYDIHNSLVTYVLTYTYEADKIHLTKKYDYQNTHTIDKQTYQLVDNKVVKITYDDDNSYYYTYGYDNIGNVKSVTEFDVKNGSNSKSVFSYDNKKGAFSMMRGANIFYFLGSLSPRAGYINNITDAGSADKPVYAHTTYQYNEDGLPVSAVVKYQDYNDDNVTYEYIIK